tara:strand:- start:3465 stop:4415 length:951 start_codon:yes stop_codon:yes gene_type:complete
MQIHQLRYVQEVSRQGLNISAAAKALNASQPTVSSQIQLLEEELKLKIFERHGKRLTSITLEGFGILELASRILLDVENIYQLASERSESNVGELTIGTTHTQARYALPHAIKGFTQKFPNVVLNVVQGTPTDIAEMLLSGKIDIGIATEALDQVPSLSAFPCYEWNRSIVVRKDHPLLNEKNLTLESIAKYPLITYSKDITGRAKQDEAFLEKGLKPKIVFTATDADVIKTYVELGLGIGIIASMAFNEDKDTTLCSIDASHLFQASTTLLAFRSHSYLKKYCYAFIESFEPNLTKKVLKEHLTSTTDAIIASKD